MAAGMTLRETSLEEFRSAFAGEIAARADLDSLAGVIHSDGELHGEELSVQMARMLRGAGPWGQGFPEPMFDGAFRIIDARIVGGKHLKLRLRELAAPRALPSSRRSPSAISAAPRRIRRCARAPRFGSRIDWR